MKQLVVIVLFLTGWNASTQEQLNETVLTFDAYLSMVKKFHPVVKQAELVIDESQAALLESRGAFDPKIEVDFDRKKFKNIEYFDQLNATFKIPTWYGVELKANFEEATGDFLNPQNNLPNDGLYSAGISVSVAQGLLINERMASLKQAKLYREQALADRDIFVNNVLYEASLAYFDWLKAYNERTIYQDFLGNAQFRFNSVKQGVEVGERAAIDSIEARITVNNRKLNLEKANVKLMKSALKLSNFLWLDGNIPVELQDQVIPEVDSTMSIDNTLEVSELLTTDFQVDNHPKMQSLDYKYQGLEVNKRLKANMLLPRIDLQYNFLSEEPDIARSFNTNTYKSGLQVYFPLFLRKERGALKLAKLKMQDTKFEINATRLQLENKIEAIQRELESFVTQTQLIVDVVSDYESLLSAEERKFGLGESSLFLVNSRESKLIDAKLKAIELQNNYFDTKALLFNSMATNPDLN